MLLSTIYQDNIYRSFVAHSVQFVFPGAYGLLSPPYFRPLCVTCIDLPFSQLCQLHLYVCDLPTLQKTRGIKCGCFSINKQGETKISNIESKRLY